MPLSVAAKVPGSRALKVARVFGIDGGEMFDRDREAQMENPELSEEKMLCSLG
jgi:hypothetical protein